MGITGMAPAQRKWPSLGVSLIQFAELHRIAHWVLCVRDADLNGCRVWSVSAWDLNRRGHKQR
jgi:hypothetical protein